MSKISLWEKAKRIVAHAFHLHTRAEIEEYYEKRRQMEIQQQLRLEHHQHVRSLMIEYADELEKYNKEKEAKRIEAEKEVLRQEMIQLYKDNRKRQEQSYYSKANPVEEDMETNTQQ